MSGPSVKIPVDWLDSFETESLGSDALVLLLTALGYSARQTSDGLVPRRVLRKLWPVEDLDDSIDRLEKAGELEQQEENFYLPSWQLFILEADEVERIREKNRERDERRRRHNRGDHSMCSAKYCAASRALRENSRESHGNSRVSHGDPIRPDPTRPLGRGGERVAASSARAPDAAPAASVTRRPAAHEYQSATPVGPCDTCGRGPTGAGHHPPHGFELKPGHNNSCTICEAGRNTPIHMAPQPAAPADPAGDQDHAA